MSSLMTRMLGRTLVGGVLAAWVVWAAAAPPPEPARPAAVDVSDHEKLSLGTVHRNAVEIFVDRPNFGFRRMPLNITDLLAPKSLADEVTPEVSQLGRLPADFTRPAGRPGHYAMQDVLIQHGGRFPTDDGKQTWQVRNVYLVGLVKHPEPMVYLVDSHPKTDDRIGVLVSPTVRGQPTPEASAPPSMTDGDKPMADAEEPKAAKDIPTRELDTFEKTALAMIRGGAALKAEKTDTTMRMLAPIYAGKSCTACHEAGTLLGGFTYDLERVAYDKQKDGERARMPKL